MAASQTTETAKIVLASTAKYATFERGVDSVYLSCDTDCYISFDETVPVVQGNALLLKKDLAPVKIEFNGGGIGKVWAIGTTGNLYILAVR